MYAIVKEFPNVIAKCAIIRQGHVRKFMMGLRNFSFSMAAAVSLKPGPKHMIVNWLYVWD